MLGAALLLTALGAALLVAGFARLLLLPGALAVVPGGKGLEAPTPKRRDPSWQHGLDLKCRRFGEAEFSDKTQVFGVEVFRDENTGSTLYISQVGAISALPGKS